MKILFKFFIDKFEAYEEFEDSGIVVQPSKMIKPDNFKVATIRHLQLTHTARPHALSANHLLLLLIQLLRRYSVMYRMKVQDLRYNRIWTMTSNLYLF